MEPIVGAPMTPQHRIGKTSEREMNEMAAESYRQITGREPMTPQPLFTITELEMRQIQQDCAYPNSESCDGCPFADGEDTTRASGLGCNFIGANRLIDEIMERSRPAPSPKSGCDGCRKEVEHLDCPRPGNCDQMKCPICCESTDFPTLPEEIKKYEEAAAAQAREDAMVEIVEELHRQFIGRTKSQILDIMCECQINPGKWLKSLRTGGEQSVY
jgi:hypothetical protein